ncbi:MAG: hypothetical protein ABI166_08130, partial [Mucilaginibacter sp.]
GSLQERVEMNTLEMEMANSVDKLRNDKGIGRPGVNNQPENVTGEQINFNITDDVDDEAVYGKNRHRNKQRGR